MWKRERCSLKLVREVLRLRFELNQSHRVIAKSTGVSKGTVGTYIDRAEIGNLTDYLLVKAVDDEKLRTIIFPSSLSQLSKIEVDFEYVHKEMQKKHVTMKLLWKEHVAVNPEFFKYSQFTNLYRKWKKQKKISMRQKHKAGEKAFIDYAGMTMPIYDRKTGEARQAQIFISALGASQLTYIEASWSQSTRDFIASNIRSFEYFEGSPEILVPDNLRAGVSVACKYEPTINQTYRELAKHYGAVVIPARVRKAQDKAVVENNVLIASRWILAALRNRKFFSLGELNEAIWELLEKFNDEKFQKLNYSRRSLFEEIEKEALQPLPVSRFVVAEWKRVKVNIDYHIQLEKCYYSVPYRLRGEYLECRYTDTTFELFHRSTRVASHIRKYKPGSTSTLSEHMPKSHRAHQEWTPTRMINWGSSIGAFTGRIFKKLMSEKEHPELAYKSCLGITRLAKRYSNDRLEKACERAFKNGVASYRSIKSILETGLDKQPLKSETEDKPIEHKNIRGRNYYH